MVQIFGTLKNFDAKTAQRWFQERRIPFQFVDLKEKEMSRGEFDSVVDAIAKQTGSRAAAVAHVCRTVCRRAERAMLRVKNENENENENYNERRKTIDEVNGDNGMVRYVNRLSDYLFILARKLNVDNNTKDVFV